MDVQLGVLITSAFTIGFLHTLLGPDHYIPFVAMSRANGWTARKTMMVTSLCGLGHVVGSILIGAIGLLLGTLVFQLEVLESFRGDVAGWLLIGFGLAYLSWGLMRAFRNVPHTHWHSHADGTVHRHPHTHDLEHRHVHRTSEVIDSASFAAEEARGTGAGSVAPWLLFLIFVFGPCEALIPLLMYPAAEANVWAVCLVLIAFTLATVGTMLAAVWVGSLGLSWFRIPNLHRFSHALAGLAVVMCGMMVKLGL